MKPEEPAPININLAVRYVDATDFGAHAVEWVLLVRGQGHLVLTVEGLPVARVQPLSTPVDLGEASLQKEAR